MLYLYVFSNIPQEDYFDGHPYIYAPAEPFENSYKKEWLENPLVKDMIKNIDKSRIVASDTLLSRYGVYTPTSLAGGTKALILMLNYYNFNPKDKSTPILNLGIMGDNTFKYIMEIAKIKDLGVAIERPFGYRPEPNTTQPDIYCVNTNKVYHNGELIGAYVDCIKMDKEFIVREE